MSEDVSVYYTYLIGWSTSNRWYYGRRTQNGCNPSELWVKYFTSSRYVKQYRAEFGEPDVIEIRRTFTTATQCKQWEATVLRRINAAISDIFLNRTNGDKHFDTTGTALAVTPAGVKLGMVSTGDPRWMTGEIVSINRLMRYSKGYCVAVCSYTGIKLGRVTTSDPRWDTGEICHPTKGRKTNRAAAVTSDGIKLGMVDLADLRWSTGEIHSPLIGKIVTQETRDRQSAVRKGRQGTFTGRTHKAASRSKIGDRSYDNQTGSNHPGSKGVWVNDTLLPTVKQAAEYIGMDESELRKILKGTRLTTPKIFRVKNITSVRYDDPR